MIWILLAVVLRFCGLINWLFEWCVCFVVCWLALSSLQLQCGFEVCVLMFGC